MVSDAKHKALFWKATPNFETLQGSVEEYLLGSGAAENWREVFVPLLSGVIEDQGKHWANTFGQQFNVRDLLGEKWFEDYQLQFSQPINQNTSDSLSELLQQAKREGWSTDSLSNRMGSMFKQWQTGDLTPKDFDWLEQRMPQYRLNGIARTEIMRAGNVGSAQLFEDWGAEEKEWLTTLDSRTRDSHRHMNGKVVPMDGYFNVNGHKMRYPLDSSAPVAEIVNCRCSLLPILAEEVPAVPQRQPQRAATGPRGMDGATQFGKDADAVAWGKEKWADAPISKDEKESLQRYQGAGYQGINPYLRGKKFSDRRMAELQDEIKMLDSILKKQTVPEDIIVWRGVNGSAFPELSEKMAGKVIEEKAYLSTAMGAKVPSAFSGKQVVMKIRVPAGTPAYFMPNVATDARMRAERELTLGRGQKMLVHSLKYNSRAGKWEAEVEILPPTKGKK